MNEESGWTPLRIIALIVGIIGVLGFGICSAAGVVLAVNGIAGTLLLTVLGLFLTFLFAMLVRWALRRSRS